jgi:hypothetical protein
MSLYSPGGEAKMPGDPEELQVAGKKHTSKVVIPANIRH